MGKRYIRKVCVSLSSVAVRFCVLGLYYVVFFLFEFVVSGRLREVIFCDDVICILRFVSFFRY